tara:strand:- start:4463 stop:5686 length:1224 start_codon:yes stop_codon:yes gene_type:complete
MYHLPSRGNGGQKVMLASPSFSGVGAGYAFSLSLSMVALRDAGIDAEPAIFDGDCHVDDARNRLVRDFLESDCTDLVFLDVDMRWEPKDLVKLLSYDRDVVGASYPLKQLEDKFPAQLIEGELRADADGLMEVNGLPTGFLRIQRNVFEKLAAKATHFMPKSDNRSPLPLIFERTVENKMRIGGDYAFCLKWKETGGKVYMDPEINLEHMGEKVWSGSWGHQQRVELYGKIKAGVMEIQNGIEINKTFMDMVEGWGNVGFSPSPDFLTVAVTLAKATDKPIFEAGSGITTIALNATGKEVFSFEHDRDWLDKVRGYSVPVYHRELKGGWYDLPALGNGFPQRFGLAILDGPPRHIGDRRGFLKSGITADNYLIDDLETPGCRELAEELGEVHCLGTHGAFAVVKGNA